MRPHPPSPTRSPSLYAARPARAARAARAARPERPERRSRGVVTRLAAVFVAACATASLVGSAAGQIVPRGPEFRVNDQTSNSQFLGHVDSNRSGAFAVTWTDDTNIKVRVYETNGTPRTPEMLVNTTTFGTQNESQVAIAEDGRFVVTWTDYNAADGELLGVLAQRFDAGGNKVGGEFFVNETTAGSQWECMVDFDDENDMFFAWVDSIPGDGSNAGIFCRVMSWTLNPLIGEFLVNDDDILQAQVNPTLRADPDGKFVIAWQSRNPGDGSFDRVLARRFSAGGTPLWPSRQVNISTSGQQTHPSVASAPNGDFAVVFTDFGGTADGDQGAVVLRIFDRFGNPYTGEIVVNQTTAGSQGIGDVAWNDEAIVVAWNDYSGADGSGAGVYARSFDRSGSPLGPERLVNQYTPGNQLDADVAMTEDGDVLIIWEEENGTDGDGSGIYGRLWLQPPLAPLPAGSLATWIALGFVLLAAGWFLGRRGA